MSDVNLDFTVSNNSIEFTVAPNDITITPSDIQLTFYNAAPLVAGGNVGELQYNAGGQLGGISSANYDAGNLTFQLANTKITGGDNHYYLQTDGTGNLTWAVGTGNMQGNGTVAGANTQIQFNDGGANFGGNAGFTFERVSGNVNIPGNLIIVGSIFGNVANANYAAYAGNVINAIQPNITSLGTLVNLTISGNTTSANFIGKLANGNSNIRIAIDDNIGFSVAGNSNVTLITGNGINVTKDLSVLGTTSIYQGIENVAIIGAQTGTYNYNLLDGAIQYSTANSTANVILNYRGNSSVSANTMLANGKSITSTYILTNGANTYAITGIQIDGGAQSIKWASNVVPGIFPNAASSYTFTIIKTSTTPTYAVLGSMTRYG
jgi:hypothetical protein